MLQARPRTSTSRLAALAAGALVFAAIPFAAIAHSDLRPALPANEVPRELEGVGIDEKLGVNLDRDLTFKDENNQPVKLGDFFANGKPTLLSLVYYSCPGLCSLHLNGVVDALKQLDWTAGEQFQVLAISFDPSEDAELAKAKKASYMEVYGRPGSEKGFHFLTATPETIKALTASVGFKYKWNEEAKEWAHASAAIVVTPEGQVSRYLPGVFFEPKTLKLALNEASSGKIGTIVDRLIMFCFHYDPRQSKYTLYASNIMKLGGLLVLLAMAAWIVPFWIRMRRSES
jgi:protein SCO1/2